MSITAVVENNTIKLPEGSHLPDGTHVRVEPIEVASHDPSKATAEEVIMAAAIAEFTAKIVHLSSEVQGLPVDLARNHDHYLHGQPKK